MSCFGCVQCGELEERFLEGLRCDDRKVVVLMRSDLSFGEFFLLVRFLQGEYIQESKNNGMD